MMDATDVGFASARSSLEVSDEGTYVTLTQAQRAVVDRRLGTWQVVADRSWPLQDTTVLQVRSNGAEYIVKASTTSHHIGREIAAHRSVLGEFSEFVPRLVHAEESAGVIVCECLPGDLVSGTAAEWDPETYRQAGSLLSRLMKPRGDSSSYLVDLVVNARRQLVSAVPLVPRHHLDAITERLDAIPTIRVPLVFTHGDFQPRNWIFDDGRVSVIDFGRAADRHWTSELVRLEHQQFVDHPELRKAFYAGLGSDLDPEDRLVFLAEQIQQAVGTVVWAHRIGDSAFEEHGRSMIGRLID